MEFTIEPTSVKERCVGSEKKGKRLPTLPTGRQARAGMAQSA
jgi:hypothetical protein